MAPIFQLLFNVFDGLLLLRRPKVCSIGQQKGDLKASLCDLREKKIQVHVLFARNIELF